VLSNGTEAALRDAIRRLHGCESSYVESVPVHEEFQGQTVWDGIVHVFDLEGHPTATRVYAWAEPADRRGRRQRFIAVLHQEPVDSPLVAVRAFVVEDHKQHGGQRG
jgi:hypothetical protein